MKELLWNAVKEFMKESVFADMWNSLCNLLNCCLKGVYNLSFYVLIILCMYNIVLAMFGSKEAKVKVVSNILIWAMIEMIATMLGV
ncbi:hypothetical protein K0040_18645 [Terrisporobacter petrolearius]|uniref:hypothetical protein n=1 Tax=Terrisporobacter petrolearius TaxID=1460447 RepID=UPI001D16F2C3|nr:hypothetical protein [Terrisporobacter petrolearius]MCC3866270.1 hypothetical protein [Terrisporobacter petrolearius]